MQHYIPYVAFIICFGTLFWMAKRQFPRPLIVATGGALGALDLVLMPDWFQSWFMGDFLKAYLPAAQATWAGDRSALAAAMSRSVMGFVNMPVIADLFVPFAWMDSTHAALTFFVFGILSSIVCWYLLVRLFSLDAFLSGLVLFLILCPGASGYNYFIGNISQYVLIFLALSLHSLMRGRDISAGVLIAIAGLLKPALILIGLYVLLRGRWRAALAGLAVFFSAFALSLVQFGWPLHQFWIEQTIAPALQGVLVTYNVQTIASTIGRFASPIEAAQPFTPIVLPTSVMITIHLVQFAVIVLGLISIVSLVKRRAYLATVPAEFSIILMIALIIPNLAWTHYFMWLLIPILIVIRDNMTPATSRLSMIVPFFAMLCVSLPTSFLSHLNIPGGGFILTVLMSMPFLGAVVLFFTFAASAMSHKRQVEYVAADRYAID